MLPNLIVIGAMKSGTTSLHYYLSLHPEISMSEEKEPTYFTLEGNWDRGLDWYESHFPLPTKIRGESSPDYTKYPRFTGVPARMHELLPDAKLVYLVRDPLARLVSHYVDAYSFGRVNGSINELLRSPEGDHFVNTSRYDMQLRQYDEYYPPERILVISNEELRDQRARVLQEVFRFLEVDDSFTSPEFEKVLYTAEEKRRKTRLGYALIGARNRVRSTGAGRRLPQWLMRPVHAFNAVAARPIPKPELDEAVRQEVEERLREDADALRRRTGKSFESWSV